MVSPLAPRALDFSTPPSSPLELHPYLSPMHDLPQRSSNPLPQTLSQGLSQTLSQPTLIDFEPSFHPINLTRKCQFLTVALAGFIVEIEPPRTGLQ
ncbi:hypothetical protein Tco_0415785 [Tanacetum coccineum]